MKTLILIFSFITITALSGCQNTKPAPTAIPPSATPLAATATATLTPTPTVTPTPPAVSFRAVGIIGQIDSLNPLLNLNRTLAKISPLLYPALNRVEPESARFEPFAAEPVTVSADNLTLTATLRLTTVTPADVQASIESAVLPELTAVRTVEITDDHTLRVTFTEPNCTAVDTLARLPILPAARVNAENPGNFVWDAAAQTLKLPAGKPTLHFFADSAAAQTALAAGEIDAIEPPELIPPTPRLVFAPFNNMQKPFDDPAVRHALSLAVDRESLTAEYLGGKPAFPVPFDPAAARKTLDAAGISDRDGDGWRELPGESSPWQVSIEVDVNREDLQPVAFWLAAYYRQIGVQARAEMVPFSTLIDDLLTGDYQIAVYDWQVDNSAVRARWHSAAIGAEFGENITGYSNPQVDALIDSLNTVPHCDPAARAEILRQINQLLADDRPADFLAMSYYQ